MVLPLPFGDQGLPNPGLLPVHQVQYGSGDTIVGKALRGAYHRDLESSPRVICTGKAPTYATAIKELIRKQKLSKAVQHRQVKSLNDVVEGGHGR